MRIKNSNYYLLIPFVLTLSGCSGGGSNSNPEPSKALFSAKNGINSGHELWITDGTETDTKLVKNINASGDSHPYAFTKVGDKWYFVADDGIHGTELWVTDGTEAGTSLVEDIAPGTDDSNPDNLIAYKGKLIFSATDGTGDTELWISDGSEAGTILIKDILPGNNSSNISNTVVFNDRVYFSAKDENHLRAELWKTDGTEAGTVLAARINKNVMPGSGEYSGSLPDLLTPFGDELIMTADSLKSDTDPIELEPYVYSTNGTVTKMKDIYVGQDSSSPVEYTVVGDKLFFAATDSSGFNLWMYSNKTTTKITSFTSTDSYQGPKFLTAVNDKLFFVATEPATGAELWISDGTSAGTKLVKDINSGSTSSAQGSSIRDLNAVGDKLFFIARGDISEEDALWISDGTGEGTIEVSKISATGSDPDISQFIALNGKLLFSANDDITGVELWLSDGTAANTILLKDINPDDNDSDPRFFKPQAK